MSTAGGRPDSCWQRWTTASTTTGSISVREPLRRRWKVSWVSSAEHGHAISAGRSNATICARKSLRMRGWRSDSIARVPHGRGFPARSRCLSRSWSRCETIEDARIRRQPTRRAAASKPSTIRTHTCDQCDQLREQAIQVGFASASHCTQTRRRGEAQLPSVRKADLDLPTLTDWRVVVRPANGDDLPAINVGMHDPDVERWIGPAWPIDEVLPRNAANWQRGAPAFVICEQVGPCVGMVWMNIREAEPGIGYVGYWLLPEARGHGL